MRDGNDLEREERPVCLQDAGVLIEGAGRPVAPGPYDGPGVLLSLSGLS